LFNGCAVYDEHRTSLSIAPILDTESKGCHPLEVFNIGGYQSQVMRDSGCGDEGIRDADGDPISQECPSNLTANSSTALIERE
jgi:hypothetical protein